MPAGEALKAAGVEPLKPFGKDGLAILSSNAYAAGLAALAVHDAEQLLGTSRLVYGFSLEGLNGNVSPLLEDVAALRPFPSHLSSTAELRGILEGSYLWQADDKRILQDPLSFRTAPYLLGSFADSLARTKALVEIQINSSDDNPGCDRRRAEVGTFPGTAWVCRGWRCIADGEFRAITLDHHFRGTRHRVGPPHNGGIGTGPETQ